MNTFPLNEVFSSVQGEGLHKGRHALFIRVPRCNLQCPWCDVTEVNHAEEFTEEALVARIREHVGEFVVITGGEPLLYPKIRELIQLLGMNGKTNVAVETNGTQPPVPGVRWYTVSPKRQTGYFIHPNLRCDELKYVVDLEFDFRILGQFTPYREAPLLWLSPEYAHMHEVVPRIMEYIATHPRWRLNLQENKWIGAR